MKFKCCGTCKHCRLDLKALNACRVLIDKCDLSDKHISNRWLRGFLCRNWTEESTAKIVRVETNMYDKEETFPDCTVQVLTNTATGEVSVGWWKNGNE